MTPYSQNGLESVRKRDDFVLFLDVLLFLVCLILGQHFVPILECPEIQMFVFQNFTVIDPAKKYYKTFPCTARICCQHKICSPN